MASLARTSEHIVGGGHGGCDDYDDGGNEESCVKSWVSCAQPGANFHAYVTNLGHVEH